MISKLKGVIDEIDEENIIIDVAGVGYKVILSQKSLKDINVGSNCVLNIEMIVKEDSLTLYGFHSKMEQKWFNILQKVQGVGAKVALAILNIFSPEELSYILNSGDKMKISQVQGIGPKLASRIINELHNNKEVLNYTSDMNKKDIILNSDTKIFGDAVNALVGLGFSKAEVFKAISEITNNTLNLTVEELIKLALAKLN